jgi:NhaP-type Na+/H+ or K+/H+ antiporter
MWDQLDPTGPHVAYVTVAVFLIAFSLFSRFIKDHLNLSGMSVSILVKTKRCLSLHAMAGMATPVNILRKPSATYTSLAFIILTVWTEPPLAMIWGILLGPRVLNIITPRLWGIDDEIIQELTRVIVGIQCFAVGIELPKHYFRRHWSSVLYFLGPIMTFSWAVTAFFAFAIFKTNLASAMIIGACLSPTDPVLAASVLAKSKFSERVPKRLKHLLSAESACNDGVSFPFLFIGITILNYSSAAESIKEWILITILWQCLFGLTLGLVIGNVANRLLRFSYVRNYITSPSFLVFYLLLAILSIGIGSTLGSDDFLVAFGAGVGFGHDGWFAKKTEELPFPTILDMMLNSGIFVFFGAFIPWKSFVPRDVTPDLGLHQLFLFLVLVLLFRRIPAVLAMKRFIPDLRTYREAWFCGHFGPMGVGALFLAMEARSELDESSLGDVLFSRTRSQALSDKSEAVHLVWPVICFVVMGSTLVHGLSSVVISLYGKAVRKDDERAPLLVPEQEGLNGMIHEGGGGESEPEISGSENDI